MFLIFYEINLIFYLLFLSSRLTSTGEDEREYQSEHETSWDELDDRYDNFTAGRERLQEFNGRIPPRKKKKDAPKPKPEKKVRTCVEIKLNERSYLSCFVYFVRLHCHKLRTYFFNETVNVKKNKD